FIDVAPERRYTLARVRGRNRRVGQVSKDTGQKPAMLIVEDSTMVLAMFNKVLELEEFNVLNAKSGSEALELAKRPDLFLIVMDVNLPDMDGFEVAERIKETAAGEAVPLIFLTALDPKNELTLRGYNAGAVDFIYKPVQPRVLQSK